MPQRDPVRLVAMIVAALLMTLLAACARPPHSHLGIPGDNAPHDGVKRAWGLPIQGMDVARYQGPINFDAARAAGVHFVYIKSTEGKDYIDPAFAVNWQRARASGMAHGAYHFMTWCSLASEQAAWFDAMVPNDPDALPPVLDIEWNNASSCKNRFDRDDLLEKIRVMLDAMEKHTGKVPIIYTDMTFHRDVLEGERFDNPFWLRSTAAEPWTRYANRDWLFWQWTQTGTMSGVKAEVDRNAFYGTENDWVTFLLTRLRPSHGEPTRPAGALPKPEIGSRHELFRESGASGCRRAPDGDRLLHRHGEKSMRNRPWFAGALVAALSLLPMIALAGNVQPERACTAQTGVVYKSGAVAPGICILGRPFTNYCGHGPRLCKDGRWIAPTCPQAGFLTCGIRRPSQAPPSR